MEISGWILTIILMLVIPFALATIGNMSPTRTRDGIGRIDTGIFLTSVSIMIIYLIYVGTLESFTLIFAIIIMGFVFFGGRGGEQ